LRKGGLSRTHKLLAALEAKEEYGGMVFIKH